MWRHRLTSIFGAIAGTAELMHRQGITIGHVGNSDVVALVGGLALIGLGLSAADALRLDGLTNTVNRLPNGKPKEY
jgi:hypothetical protein